MKPGDAGLSFKVAAVLTLAVLALHLVFLQGAALTAVSAYFPSRPARSVSTRTMDVVPLRQSHTPGQATPRPLPAKPRPLAAPVSVVSATAQAIAGDGVDPAIAVADPLAPTQNEGTPVPDLAVQINDDVGPVARQLREQISSAQRFAVPDSLTLHYRVQSNKFPYGLNAELVWQNKGENYEARLAIGAFGFMRVQTSRGQITPDGLAPVRFSDKYRSEVAAHFVRDKGKIVFSANTADVALLSGAQDRLSVVVQLAAMWGAEPSRFALASTIALQTVSARDADIWLFTVENDEILELPGGLQPTHKLVRNARREFDQKVELWLAPALGYLPARIRITEANGDYIDQQWLAGELAY